MSHCSTAKKLLVATLCSAAAFRATDAASGAPQRPSTRAAAPAKASSAFVPGTGTLIEYASDDFEEEGWAFDHRMPKSSREQDEQVRYPMGRSTNNRWHEGPERGQPDYIQVVKTPPGGLEGSERALMLRTLNSGIPRINSRDVQQDDLIANCVERLRGGIHVSEQPSVVVRVYLPPAEQWERRTGPHFGFRTSATTTTTKTSGGFFGSSKTEPETYWPGMWIHFRPGPKDGSKPDSAWITVRANRTGHDFNAMEITQFGWWTLGMSYSSDGMVHYFASPGVDDLTMEDYITSQNPYGFRAVQFRTYFFDVCNWNDGRTWSTPFVIDDPQLFVRNAQRINGIVARAEAQEAQRAARQAAAAERASQQKTSPRRTSSRSSNRR